MIFMKKTMNVRDIPAFIDAGNYAIDCPVHRLPEWIKDHVEECGLVLNPDFQRGHVWTKEQQTAYMEFILRGGNSGRDLYFNQPGWMNDFTGDFVCVDGLQRITAICDFMADKVPVFGGYVASEIEGLKQTLCRYTMKIHVNNLPTKNDVLRWYVEMNEGGTPHTAEEIARVKAMISDK